MSKRIRWTRGHETRDGRFWASPVYRGGVTVQGWTLYDALRAGEGRGGRVREFDRLSEAKEWAQHIVDQEALALREQAAMIKAVGLVR